MAGEVLMRALVAALVVAGCKPHVEAREPIFVSRSPKEGDLASIAARTVSDATAAGRAPLIYAHAGWCASCQAVDRGLEDARMIAAFDGAYVTELDVDQWQGNAPDAWGVSFRKIPLFVRLDSAGRPAGTLDGDAWGETDSVEAMAPVIGAFVHPNR
jgi:hypothetical protein